MTSSTQSQARPRPSSRRQAALKRLLDKGQASTQEELREGLRLQKFEVNQSTISRDLRKIGAIKAIDSAGRTTYRLPSAEMSLAEGGHSALGASVGQQILGLQSNPHMMVIQTRPGSASLVARVIDQARLPGILGTIAGDDTIFVALATGTSEKLITKRVSELFPEG